MPETMPWYRSQIILGAFVSILSKVLLVSGIISDIAPEDEEQFTSLLVLTLGGVGDLWAIVARITQKRAPLITPTKQ